jgi:NAD+ synthase
MPRRRARLGARRARRARDLVALPEMFITGYNAQDLVMKPAFPQRRDRGGRARRWPRLRRRPGACHRCRPAVEGGKLYNAYYILQGRAASPRGAQAPPAQRDRVRRGAHLRCRAARRALRGGQLRIGSPICEDAWHPDVAETLAETGAEFLLVPNGSPYYRGKFDVRMNHMVARVSRPACR